MKSTFRTDSFALKVIAIIGMTANHIGHVFHTELPPAAYTVLVGFGGLTFPIMAFLLTVGYQHTRDVGRYAKRLGLFALISLVPFIWALEAKLNVMFVLLMGLGIIWADDNLENRLVFWTLFAAATVASHWCDWSYIGIPMILLYHRTRESGWQAVLPLMPVWLMGLSLLLEVLTGGFGQGILPVYLPDLLYSLVGATATVPLVHFYSNERGRPMKYFFYAYYPGHLALLALARGLLFNIWWV